MIDIEHIRLAVVKGLKDHLGIPVIKSNQTGEPPAYPYCSYTITTLMKANNGTWGKYDDGKLRKPTEQIWSFTIQSDDSIEANRYALQAHDWLDCVGRTYLNDKNIIIQSVSDIGNRDNLITIEYEYRLGFDFVIWLLNEVDDTTEQTGVIEAVDVGGEVVTPPVSVEELNDRLENRLEGDS